MSKSIEKSIDTSTTSSSTDWKTIPTETAPVENSFPILGSITPQIKKKRNLTSNYFSLFSLKKEREHERNRIENDSHGSCSSFRPVFPNLGVDYPPDSNKKKLDVHILLPVFTQNVRRVSGGPRNRPNHRRPITKRFQLQHFPGSFPTWGVNHPQISTSRRSFNTHRSMERNDLKKERPPLRRGAVWGNS